LSRLRECYYRRVKIDPTLKTFIDAQRVGRLATVDGEGRPHIIPVCFALDGTTVYSAIDEKPKSDGPLRRLRNIAENAHVQLLLDVYDDADWTQLRYVQLRGTARIIESGAEHARAIARLRMRYAQYSSMALEEHPVIAIEVDHVVRWRGG
jgi:PPOX class probable F420-dependent enzyme